MAAQEEDARREHDVPRLIDELKQLKIETNGVRLDKEAVLLATLRILIETVGRLQANTADVNEEMAALRLEFNKQETLTNRLREEFITRLNEMDVRVDEVWDGLYNEMGNALDDPYTGAADAS